MFKKTSNKSIERKIQLKDNKSNADTKKTKQKPKRNKTAEQAFPKIARLAKELTFIEMKDLVNAQTSDTGNAERLRILFGQNIMYVPEQQAGHRWHVWTGKRWRPVCDEQMYDFISFTMRKTASLYDTVKGKAGGNKKISQRDDFAKYCVSSENLSRLKATLQRASSMVLIHINDLDADPMLLNVKNGMVDLRSGELLPHDKEKHCTRICNAEYVPGAAKGSLWEKTIQQILPNSDDLEYMHVYSGYMATGMASEESLLFLFGDGGTGKGTFANTLDYVLGGYSDTFDPEILLSSRNDCDGGKSASPGKAKLAGLRAAWASETGLGRKLNEAALKNLTGRDDITARFLFGQPFTFQQNAKLVISSNYMPNLKDTNDGGIRRRLKIINFDQVFAGKEQKNLKELLREPQETAAVLDWIVQGAVTWASDGMPELPSSVKNTLNEYYEENDWLADALAELTIPDPKGKIKASMLIDMIHEWQGVERYTAGTSRSALVNLISKHGYQYKRLHGVRHFYGLRERSSSEPPAVSEEPSTAHDESKSMSSNLSLEVDEKPQATDDYAYSVPF